MSALKDIFDLIEKFEKSVTDRKTLDLLFPIKEKIILIQHENLEMEKNNFESEKRHYEEMNNLKNAHSKEVNKLKSKISELETKLNKPKSGKVGSIDLSR